MHIFFPFKSRSSNLRFKVEMILFFHFICLLARYIVLNISKTLNKSKVFTDDENEDDFCQIQSSHYLKSEPEKTKLSIYENGTIKFFPPVFVQRYETVALILQDSALKGKIKKVVDFGCAELGFFMYLKSIESVTEILEVDIDSEILERFSFKAAPLTSDYLMGKSIKPLDVYILAGSIADYDDCLFGCDAVIAIELIEHLAEKDFDSMPYNVFYKIKPKLAIFTTPNADFNLLFPSFTGVRHKDHKFEWTRREFYNWTQEILNLYPEYSVKFYGIGAGPEGTENLGCCTQMAVFQRSDDTEFFSSAREETGNIHSYKLIKHYEYPVYTDTRTTEEKIVHEIQYHSAHLKALDTYYNYECNESEIPLSLLKEYVSDLCNSDEELVNILTNNGMTLRKKNNFWYLVCTDSESNSSGITFSYDDWLNEEISESFWDRDNLNLEERWSDDEQLCEENVTDFQSARSLDDLESNLTSANSFFNKVKQDCLAKTHDETKSAPDNCTHSNKLLNSPKTLYNSQNVKAEKVRKLNSVKSKIPRKKNEKRRDSSVNGRKTNLSYVCTSFRKITKSCSLDSCLDMIKYKSIELEYNSKLTPGASSPFKSPSWARKDVINNSHSFLLTSNFNKASQSDYSFSSSSEDSIPSSVERAEE